MNLAESIERHLVDIPADAELLSVDVHQDDDYPADCAGCLCEFSSGDMFTVFVPLEGKPFDAALRSEIEAGITLAVAVAHGLHVPEVSHV